MNAKHGRFLLDITSEAAQQLSEIPENETNAIMRALAIACATSGRKHIRKLDFSKPLWRVRGHYYRAVCKIDSGVLTVFFVAHRNEVYRKLKDMGYDN